MHDFRASVAISDHIADAEWWESLYRAAFGPRYRHSRKVTFEAEPLFQRQGLDRMVYLDGGGGTEKLVLVEEKVRRQLWTDVLLEIWSDKARKHPGWAKKPLHCDYIVYAFPTAKRAYLIPFLLMQNALRENYHEWLRLAQGGIEGFGLVEAQNKGYVTQSLAVPLDALLAAMASVSMVSWP